MMFIKSTHTIIRKQRLAALVITAVCCIITAAVIAPPVLGRQITPTKFNPAAYKGPMGKIQLGYKGQCILTIRDKKTNKLLQLTSTNGTFQAPAGSYDIISFKATGSDDKKAKWIANSISLSKTLTIKANSTEKLSLGPPFTASVAVKMKGRDQVTMDFKLIGSDSAKYIINKASGRSNPPGFKVIDEQKKVVWQGSFKYG